MREDSNHRPSMDGEAIFQFASTYNPVIVKDALLKADLTLDELDYLVPHQANLRIIEKAVHNLDFPLRRLPPMLSSTMETPHQQVLHSLLLMK